MCFFEHHINKYQYQGMDAFGYSVFDQSKRRKHKQSHANKGLRLR